MFLLKEHPAMVKSRSFVRTYETYLNYAKRYGYGISYELDSHDGYYEYCNSEFADLLSGEIIFFNNRHLKFTTLNIEQLLQEHSVPCSKIQYRNGKIRNLILPPQLPKHCVVDCKNDGPQKNRITRIR